MGESWSPLQESDVTVRLNHIHEVTRTPLILGVGDRKSTRLNSSHGSISYAVFCLKKKMTEPAPSSPTHTTRVEKLSRTRLAPPKTASDPMTKRVTWPPRCPSRRPSRGTSAMSPET